jgi:hypothetical protein
MKDFEHEALVLEGRVLRLENTQENVADEDLKGRGGVGER